MYEKTLLGLAEARAAVDAVLAAAASDETRPIVVCVSDADGETILFARMDRTSHLSRRMAVRKAYTSARMAMDSGSYGEQMRAAGIALSDLDPVLTGFGGGICLRVGGSVVGAIAVSGRSGDEDDDLARVGAATLAP